MSDGMAALAAGALIFVGFVAFCLIVGAGIALGVHAYSAIA